jgi:hypothetical protein
MSEIETNGTGLFNSNKFETVIVILLGISAVVTAWASWQASLYGGQQATKYTQGTAAVSEGNSMYNEASSYLENDMQLYYEINSLYIDLTFAQEHENEDEIDRLEWKIDEIYANRVTDELSEAIDWADAEAEASDEMVSPFDMEGFIDSYFEDALARIEEGQDTIEDGQSDNHLGDILNMSTVIFAVAMFLLGICNTFTRRKIQIVIAAVSLAAIVVGTGFMLTVPVISQF